MVEYKKTIGIISPYGTNSNAEYGYRVEFQEDVTEKTVEIGTKTPTIFIQDNIIVGIDTGTVFDGPMPSTGKMYALLELKITDDKIDPIQSKVGIAERDRYDGGSKQEYTLEELYAMHFEIEDWNIEDLLGKSINTIDFL